ncbi:MAG: M16 family metallopeptidase [Longimicrobiales bacterium]
MRQPFSSLTLLLSLTAGLGAQSTPEPFPPVQEYRLENGLRLLVLPRGGPPTVSFVVQYAVGSVNERPGVTGIAHLLEHLLFKGTTSVGTRDYEAEIPLLREMDLIHDSILVETDSGAPDSVRIRDLRDRIRNLEREASAFVVSNEFDAILSENGARSLNAVTTSESTAYFVELPANRVELWFILEGDRMRSPVFREFYTERDVVAEERRLRLETNPSGLLHEAHLAEAFQVHPYGRPVVGSMEDIQRLSRREVQDYFRRFYGPNNAVVAIVGNVDPEQILRWAQQYLAPVPEGTTLSRVEVREPEQTGERRIEVVLDAEPSLRIGWRVPPVLHEDGPSLAMLASILTGGRSSRIYRRLVLEDRIASGVTSGTGPGNLYPGLFSIDVTPLASHSHLEVEEAIYEELDRLKAQPPDEMELQRVRNQLEASQVRRLTSNLGLALQLAQSASLYGDWKQTFAFSRAMQAVTPEDLQRVVQRYFTEDHRTVAVLSKVAGQEENP